MLTSLFACVAKLGVGLIAGRIAAAYEALQRAATDTERLAAEERIKMLEARRDVLVTEAGSRLNALMRAAIATPVAIILWKIFVFDEALGQCTGGATDALSPELWHVVMIVIGFYFLSETASAVTRITRRK